MSEIKRGRKRKLRATLVMDIETDFYENDWPGTLDEQIELTLYERVCDIVHLGEMEPGIGSLHNKHFYK